MFHGDTMTSPLQHLINNGTKLWLDSIDPDLVIKNRALGATGATSNPIIVANLIKSGRWDNEIQKLAQEGLGPEDITWQLTDRLVSQAEEVFLPVFTATKGDDGYVSFELDPLLEATDCPLSQDEKVTRYVSLGKKWSQNHPNRMIKIPATAAGIAALEPLAAAGIHLNVTLLFSSRQYQAARDAIYRGYQKAANKQGFKAVFSIFVSRLDVYSEQHLPALGSAQGWLGLVNAKRLWQQNRTFWQDKHTELSQEIIFASTGTKKPSDPKWKYLEGLCGSDIQTNPPETNDALEQSGHAVAAGLDQLPDSDVLNLIDQNLDEAHMEQTLMTEGLAKFADPQKELIKLVASKIA